MNFDWQVVAFGMLDRRDLVRVGTSVLASALSVAPLAGQSAGPPADPAPRQGGFDTGAVLNIARELAKAPYKQSPADLPDFLSGLTYEQYVAIRAKPSVDDLGVGEYGLRDRAAASWFRLFRTDADIPCRQRRAPQARVPRRATFDFGSIQPPANVPDIAFSGIPRPGATRRRVRGNLPSFRARVFSERARRAKAWACRPAALSVRTADARGEEFPVFKGVWIERPNLSDNTLVVHALLDSESTVGVYRMSIRPGEATIIDTEMTLLPRVKTDFIGIATMSARSISTPLDRRRPDDIRPEHRRYAKRLCRC